MERCKNRQVKRGKDFQENKLREGKKREEQKKGKSKCYNH